MDDIVRILAEHIAVSHRGHFACMAEGCDWGERFPYNKDDLYNPKSGPRIAFAVHQKDLLREVLDEVWDDGAEAATEHWVEHMYDPNSNGPVDPPLNPYRKDQRNNG